MIILDNKPLREFNLIAGKGHTNPSSASFNEQTIAIPQVNGVYYIRSENGVKKLRIPLVAIDKNNVGLQKKLREFNDFFHDSRMQKRLVKLFFEYEQDKYYEVRLNKPIDASKSLGVGEFDLDVTSYKGISLASVENHEIDWDSEIVTFDDSYSIDTVFVEDEQITSPQTVQTYVNGYAIRPSILIKGSGDNVTLQSNGKSFSLKNFVDSQFDINGQSYTVIKDNQNGYDEKIGSHFLELLPGMNHLVITGDNMNFTLSIKFRDQYM